MRGIDVLKLTSGAQLARASKREVVAKPMSRKQRRFLARQAWVYRADPGHARPLPADPVTADRVTTAA